jgi:LuxR family transcriptional regulator, maltose regulon positive regulatory protein
MGRQEPPGRPARQKLVPRQALLAALDRGAAGRVTIIAAPPGSGKTSLLRSWTGQPGRSRRFAAVQVQRGWRDPQLFWLSLLKAARTLSAEPAGVGPAATPTFSESAAVDEVLVELDGHEGDVTLIIDDIHELKSLGSLEHLTRLLTELPSGVSAVLATRRDLPLRLHQLRLTGELTELRAADLQFTTDETVELLESAGVKLSPQSLTLLHRRTEGWAAGLRLAALSLAGHPDPDRFVANFTGSNRDVADYLVAELLERQTPEVQDLLLRTSILQEISGELADALTGGTGSERFLLELEDANMLVVSLDAQRTWFRYHHLFGDLLRLELRRRLPDEVHVLHRRAADWLADHGRAAEAVRHRQAAGDWPVAAELLADHAFGMMLDGQEETMQSLLLAFPHEGQSGFPELNVVRATVALVHGQLDDAAAYVAGVDGCLGELSADRVRRTRIAVASLKLVLARRRGDLAEVARQAQFLTAPSGEHPAELMAGSDLRVIALQNLGIAEAWSSGASDAERHLQEGADLARTVGRPYLEVACLAQLGFATKLSSLAASRKRCEQAIALAEQHGWGNAVILAPALVTLACSLVFTGELDSADYWLNRAGQVLQNDSGPGIRTQLYLVKGMVQAARGRHKEAFEEFRHADDMQSQLVTRHALSGFVVGWMCSSQARAGGLDEVRTYLEALAEPLSDSAEIRNAHGVLALAENRPGDALAAAAPIAEGTVPVVHESSIVEAHLVRALAFHAIEDDRAAHQALEQALEIAEPERLILPFLMTGAGELLEKTAPGRSEYPALRAEILDVVHGTSLPERHQAPAAGLELSPTELRVLRYMPTNLSRPEIAGELYVSVNTVNTHFRNIYRKLEAADRSTAVRRAREFRLLSGNPAV